ncbi:MAG TPA: acyl-CoA thioesterase [Myxococcaceae bacterium]|nr:acyl-CoA thioesterase [Myxococcaceae bacterium]
MRNSEVEHLEPGRLTSCTLIEMVFPEQTNHYGTLFGGQALALMDKAAFIVASRYARRAVVTASSEKCDFHVPVRQGQLVELMARVIATGRTSMTVEVDLFSEDLLTGDRQLGTRGRFTMVALDAHGRPAEVPSLQASPKPDAASLAADLPARDVPSS